MKPKRVTREGIAAAKLSGHVARRSDAPRSRVAEYLERHSYLAGIDQLADAWLTGWDLADEAIARGDPLSYLRPVL